MNDSIVEDVELNWFVELSYAIGHGSHLAPSELLGKAGELYVVEATP
ncbi:MAG: hypothetical protein ACYC9L_11365 [Sulfuricaulis sp.]